MNNSQVFHVKLLVFVRFVFKSIELGVSSLRDVETHR